MKNTSTHSFIKTIPQLFLCGLLSPTVYAVDGVVEINHTCAVHTGCFSGDTLGYPVTIDSSAGKSYRLTSDLIIPDASGAGGIFINAHAINVDLNGFEIINVACVGATVSTCRATNPTVGIFASNSSHSASSVKNGGITGMGTHGILLQDSSNLTDLVVRWNGTAGIYGNDNSKVVNCQVYENQSNGIDMLDTNIIKDNIVYSNGSNGISTRTSNTITGNISYKNGADGINAAGYSNLVSGNTSYQNTTDGIDSSYGGNIINNTVYNNGDDGIEASKGSSVQGNSVYLNTAYGLNPRSSPVMYKDNMFLDNGASDVAGQVDDANSYAKNMGGNFCDSAICP